MATSGRSPANRADLAKNWLLAAAALVVPLALLEGGARWLLPPPPPNALPGLSASEMPDDALLWRNRPGYAREDHDGPINSLGFRGEEIARMAAPGTVRILSLGESTTFGSKIAWRETYSNRLEARLRAEGRAVQVINGAVRAWSTVQSTRFLEAEIDVLAPDLVLFYHEVNDFLPTTFRGIAVRGAGLSDEEMIELSSGRAGLRRLARRSRLLTHVNLALARARADAAAQALGDRSDTDALLVRALPYRYLPEPPEGTPPWPALPSPLPWMDNPNPVVRVPDAERDASLRRLVDLARSRDATLLLLHPAYPVSAPHRCLLTRVAREHHLAILDVETALAEDARRTGMRRTDYFHRGDPFHPNATGHAVIARALARLLVESGLLTMPDGGPA